MTNNNMIIKIYKIIIINNKTWFFYNVFFAALSGLEPLVTLFISKKIIDEIQFIITNRNATLTLNRISMLLVLQVIVMVLYLFLNKFQNYLGKKTEIGIGHYIQKEILLKISNVPLYIFENNEFQNRLMRIQNSVGQRFLKPLAETIDLLKNSISFITMIYFLFSINKLLASMIILSSIPIFIINIKFGYQRFGLLMKQTETQRDIIYTSRLLQDTQSIKEVKIYNLSKHLINRWSLKYWKNNDTTLGLYKKQISKDFLIDLYKTSVYVYIFFSVINIIKENSKFIISNYIVILQAIVNSQSKLSSIAINISTLFEDKLFIKEYFEFVEDSFHVPIVNEKSKFPVPLTKGIFIENASFSYPNARNKAFEDVSLMFKVGEKIAIVGENGSGKSTLIKCLLGLYPLSNGKVYFDDIEINSIDLEDLSNNVAVLFQDFLKFPYTISENIGFGDVSNINNLENIKNASLKSGAAIFIEKLKHKYQTNLTKILVEGEELSGGQWQRIALSRAILRNAELLFLDEPTSALDPMAEFDFFDTFYKITSNKTTIFITHKLTSLKFIDKIVVMKQGRVVEFGTFAELIQSKGEFSRMYEVQTKQMMQLQTV